MKTLWLPSFISMAIVASVVQAREWSDVSGRFSIEAELVRVKNGDAILKAASGRIISVPLEKLSKAFLQHEKFWRQTMLPLVKKSAGPDQESLGFELHAVRGRTTDKCGIAVKNICGRRLHNLCLAVNSRVGFPGLNKRIHYVAVEALDVNQEVMLSWRLIGALIEPGSNPDMGDGIVFSAWSTEFSNSERKLTLPKDISIYRKTQKVGKRIEWVPFRLKLAEPT
ncbi:MAG: SHD1 domain-containing protein [Pirellulales bacterium]